MQSRSTFLPRWGATSSSLSVLKGSEAPWSGKRLRLSEEAAPASGCQVTSVQDLNHPTLTSPSVPSCRKAAASPRLGASAGLLTLGTRANHDKISWLNSQAKTSEPKAGCFLGRPWLHHCQSTLRLRSLPHKAAATLTAESAL